MPCGTLQVDGRRLCDGRLMAEIAVLKGGSAQAERPTDCACPSARVRLRTPLRSTGKPSKFRSVDSRGYANNLASRARDSSRLIRVATARTHGACICP